MPQYVGIDLGTTYSCIAYLDENDVSKITRNKEGEEETPSVVLFDNNQKAIVGSTAKRQAILYPNTCMRFFKRDMGEEDLKYDINGEQMKPQKISSFVLLKLKKDFESEHGCVLNNVVITVPAYFGLAETNATQEAGRIAGFDNVITLPEPVAASIAYGLMNADSGERNIVVYDLGGGTFDSTILNINGNTFTVKGITGNKFLGGKDWDDTLVGIIAEKLVEGGDSGKSKSELLSDPQIALDLSLEAEVLKRELSSENVTEVQGTYRIGLVPIGFTITREEFEEKTKHLIGQTIDLLDEAIIKAGMTIKDIDEIVLVGGSTRMPQVGNAIRQKYPGAKYRMFEPSQAVAKGAAIYAKFGCVYVPSPSPIPTPPGQDSQGGKGISEKPIILNRALSKTFGVLALIEENGTEKERVSNIIFRNAKLPATNERAYYPSRDKQSQVEVEVFENDTYYDKTNATTESASRVTPIEMSSKIGSFLIDLPSPSEVSRNDEICVLFNAAADGTLYSKVTFKGQSWDKNFDISSGVSMSEEEIEEERNKVGLCYKG